MASFSALDGGVGAASSDVVASFEQQFEAQLGRFGGEETARLHDLLRHVATVREWASDLASHTATAE